MNLEERITNAIRKALLETKWRFDARIGGVHPVEKRNEDNIMLMSQMPQRRGYVVLFQNRVNLNSAGNLHGKQVAWYDSTTHTSSSDKDMEDAQPWMAYMLPCHGRPQGWMAKEDYQRLGFRI